MSNEAARSHETPSAKSRRFWLRTTRYAALGLAFYGGAAIVDARAQSTISAEEQARLAASDSGDDAVTAQSLALPFRDSFDGSDLGGQWRVVNENRDLYLPEGGSVLGLAQGGASHPKTPDSANIFQLNSGLPDADFDLSVGGRLEAKTGFETVWVGLRNDENDYLAASLQIYTQGCGAALYLHVESRHRHGDGEDPVTSAFHENLFDGPFLDGICSDGPRAYADTVLAALNENGFTLTLSRRGYRWFASAEMELPASGDWPGGSKQFSTAALARFESFGQPFFMIGQDKNAGSGESVAQFDEISITPVQ